MRRIDSVMRAGATAAAAVVLAACASQGVPLQKGYGSTERPLFDLVLTALRDLGVRVVAESPARDAATAHVSAETAGIDLLMEVSLAHRLADVTYVQVAVWSEAGEVSREDQDAWRERFFAALDALAAPERRLPSRSPEPPSGEPR